MDRTNNCLSKFNNIIKESDEIYRNAAKLVGLSDCAFWILYALRTDENPLTQKEICYATYQPKQTVNSALKKLEADGYVELFSADDRRSKQVRLTKRGLSLAQRTVDKVILQEQNALSELSPEEQDAFLQLFRKYTDLLNANIQTLTNEREES